MGEGWLPVALSIMGALGGAAGLVSLLTLDATRKKLAADTAGKLVEASGQLVDQLRQAHREEIDALRKHRKDCEQQLEDLAERVRELQRAGSMRPADREGS